MNYVEVYDDVNKDRLLGSIRRPTRGLVGRCYLMAVCGPVSLDDEDDCRVNTIVFTYDYKIADGGYRVDAVFRTSAPLKKLLLIRQFRLPGESESQAYHRWNEARFS